MIRLVHTFQRRVAQALIGPRGRTPAPPVKPSGSPPPAISLRSIALACAIGLAVSPTPAAAAPALAPAAHAGRITILAEPGLESVARDLAGNAERTLDRIAADLADLPTPRAIEVRLVRDAADLAAVAPANRGAPSWAIGVAYPDLNVIGIAMRRGANNVDPEATLRHELAHIALGAALGARAPHWLHEGFAYQHSAEWSWERMETLAGMTWLGGIIPLDQLDATFPEGEQPAHRAYAESYDFVGYLSRRGRWEDVEDDGDRWPFRRFLREVGRGVDLDSAAQHAFGKPLHELFNEWRSNLSNRYMVAPIGLLGLVVWILCALLLMLAWWRRRRQNRRRIAQWELDDPTPRSETGAQVVAPPYVPWPGEDPLATEPDDDDKKPDDPRWMN
jgi:Peptidase MA superfamily